MIGISNSPHESGELGRMRGRARTPSLHHDRNERHDAERGECREQLRRDDHAEVELQLAVGGAGGKASAKGAALRGENIPSPPPPRETKIESQKKNPSTQQSWRIAETPTTCGTAAG